MPACVKYLKMGFSKIRDTHTPAFFMLKKLLSRRATQLRVAMKGIKHLTGLNGNGNGIVSNKCGNGFCQTSWPLMMNYRM